MKRSIREPERDLKVLDEVDVLVAGAGVAGCAAAVAAARTGAKTMLLERNGCLGGVATAGLMANIGNTYLDRDGRVVVHGISREVIERMAARGAASEKWACREVPGVVIDSEHLKVLLIEMQDEAGVRTLTHTLAARPIIDGDRVAGAFIESKAGREAVLARQVVDATGEADLAERAGCPTRWTGGSASLEFKMAGVDLDALYRHFKRYPETFPVGQDMVKGFAEFERNWVERGILFFPHGGGRKWNLFQEAIERGEYAREKDNLWALDASGLYGLRQFSTVIVNSNFWRVETLEAEPLARAELDTQKICYYVADFFRGHIPGFEKAFIAQLATDLGIRTSRVIEGEKTLTGDVVSSREPVEFDDAIGRAPARAKFGEDGEFFHAHDFEIPYGCMVPKEIDNLLVASGKSVSAEPRGVIRGMACCMILGQGAGTAAALAARSGVAARDVDMRALQAQLSQDGVRLAKKTED